MTIKTTASELSDEYQAFFKEKLESYGVKSPGDLDDDVKKKFFNEVELEWEEGKGPAKSEASVSDRLDALVDRVSSSTSVPTGVLLALEAAAEAVAKD